MDWLSGCSHLAQFGSIFISKHILCCSCIFEPEGNACSLTDSTAEEHVLALVEHAADEARDRINRCLPNSKVLLLNQGSCFLLVFGYSVFS